MENTTALDSRTTIEELLVDCACALFEAYERPLTYTGTGATKDEAFILSGVIGFTGPHARGTLLLAMNQGLLDYSNPGSTSARDWIAELSNQLLGRLKNQLLRFGAEVYVSTPLVLRGEYIAPVPSGSALSPHRFECPHGVAAVWLDCEFQAGYELVPVDAAPPMEGDTFMFD